MLKRAWLVCVFLSGIPLFAQTNAFQGFCNRGGQFANVSGLNSTNRLQNVIPSCTVTVYLTGTTTLATIYSNATSTPLANPFTADATTSLIPGHWLFYAADGQGYDVIGSGGIAPNTYPSPVPLWTDGIVNSGGGGCTTDCVVTDPLVTQFINQPAGTSFTIGGNSGAGTPQFSVVGVGQVKFANSTSDGTESFENDGGSNTCGNFIGDGSDLICNFKNNSGVLITGRTQIDAPLGVTSDIYTDSAVHAFGGYCFPVGSFASAACILVPGSLTPYDVIWPGTQGTGALTNDGAGNLSWVPGGGSGPTIQTNTVNNSSQTVLNLVNSTVNSAGLSFAFLNPSGGNVKGEVAGTYVGSGASIGTGTIPVAALVSDSTTVNSQTCTLGSSCTVTATATNPLTMNNSGSGAISGSTFDGSAAKTISYNTIGASPTAGSSSITTVGTVGSGTWQGTAVSTTFGGTGQNWGSLSGIPSLNAGSASLFNTSCSGATNALIWNSSTEALSCNTISAGTGTVTDGTGSTTANQLAVATAVAHVQTYVTTLPTAAVPAFIGDVTNTAGSLATTVGKINGGSVPASANLLATNGSSQPVAATAHNVSVPLTCSDTSASGTAQVCTTSPSFTPAANDCIIYTTTTANSGAGLTLNVNSLGAKSVAKWQGSTTLNAGDVAANNPVEACYNGIVWNLATIGNSPSGSGTSLSLNSGGAQASLAVTGYMPQTCPDSSGSGTAQVCSTATAFTPQTGNCLVYKTTTANSGTGLTVNVNSLGAKSVAVPGTGGWTTTLIASSSIAANKPLHLCYDGTNWNASGTGFQAGGSTITSPNGTIGFAGTPTMTADVAPATYWSSQWSSSSSVTLSGSGNIKGIGFTVDVPVTFSAIYAVIHTIDASNSYSMSIANSSGTLICSPAAASTMPTANALWTNACQQGTVTIYPGNVYILLWTGNSATGTLNGVTGSSVVTPYSNSSVAGCSSSGGLITGTCTISLAVASTGSAETFFLH